MLDAPRAVLVRDLTPEQHRHAERLEVPGRDGIVARAAIGVPLARVAFDDDFVAVVGAEEQAVVRDAGRGHTGHRAETREQGAEGFASELQDALRGDALFERWRAKQDDPDAVDALFGATDPGASVTGKQDDLHVSLVVDTSLPSAVLRQRLSLLAGTGWQLRDVTSA